MWPRGQQVHLVMPAQAGIQSTQHRIFWVPAFADILLGQFILHGSIFFGKVRPIFSLRFAQNLGTDLVKQLICCDCATAAQLMCNK